MLKKVGSFALGTCFFAMVFAVPLLFIKGAVWASTHLLEPLITIGWWVLAIDVILVLPLALYRRARWFSAVTILYSSFVFGLIAWLTGFVVTYTHWGAFGVMLGLLLVGVGVVPLGLLASAFHGWDGFVPLIVLVVLTFASRALGYVLAASAERQQASRPGRPLSAKQDAEAKAAFDSLLDRSESDRDGL